jgi:serine/threonine protein kinase
VCLGTPLRFDHTAVPEQACLVLQLLPAGSAVVLELPAMAAGAGQCLHSSMLLLPRVSTGTPNYMAPELFNGTHVDEAADVYSLGGCCCCC